MIIRVLKMITIFYNIVRARMCDIIFDKIIITIKINVSE